MSTKKSITEAEVKHVADLANLTLSDKELQIYTKQLQEVLDYMKQLDEVDTSNTKPTYQVIDGMENIYRDDIVSDSFSQKESLSQANKEIDGYFAVKNVFGEGKKIIVKKQPKKRKEIDEFNAILTEVDEKGTVAHKDLFMTEGVETTAGSNVLDGYIPQYSSTVVRLLEKEGLRTKYKVNQDAWGHGASGENSDFGPTKNPWDKKRVAGGSSSGSGAAVAAGMVNIATGTDTGGSIRMPANYCNLVSIKPTYGAVSRHGVIAFASSLDCPSLIANDIDILYKYFKKIYESDKFDANSQSKLRNIKTPKTIKKIGLPKEFFEKGLDSQIKKTVIDAANVFKREGYEIVDVSLPHSKYGVSLYYIIAPTETSSNLARYDGIRYGQDRSHFGAEAKRRIMLGTYASSAGYADKYYEKASRVRSLVIDDCMNVFEKADVILAPVSPVPPFLVGEKVNDPLKMYLMDAYTFLASLSGTPSMTLPCGFTKDKLPIGMQLIGPRWSEEVLFEIGMGYQKITDWHNKKPLKRS